MRLAKTLKTLRQIPTVSDTALEPDDALLVGDIELVLRVLRKEAESLPDDGLEPTLLLALSKLYKSIGDAPRSLAMFQRATTFLDQNRGYYSDIGYCCLLLCREGATEEFCLEVREAVQRLLSVCPFSEDLKTALGHA